MEPTAPRVASIALALVLAILAGAPLAFAGPPDPLWVGGVFDAGDTDDVVAAALSAESAAPGSPDLVAEPVLAPTGGALAAGAADPPRPPLSARRDRAPPAA